jgi:hypothetical protein
MPVMVSVPSMVLKNSLRKVFKGHNDERDGNERWRSNNGGPNWDLCSEDEKYQIPRVRSISNLSTLNKD